MPLIRKNLRDACWHCEAEIVKNEDGYFAPIEYANGGIDLVQVCAQCYAIELALLEAKEDKRRYTEIDCTDRCNCGAAVHAALGFCVRCWRERRMLGAQEANVRFNRRLISQLKKELKNGKN